MHSPLATLLLLIGLGLPAITQAAATKAPTLEAFCESLGTGTFSGIQGIPDVLAMRGCAWRTAGLINADNEPDLLHAAKAGQGAPGSTRWVAAFATLGDRYFAKGEQAESMGRVEEARHAFESAAHFFYLARWPHLFSQEAEHAYERHLVAARRAARYLDPPLRELTIDFEGKTVVAHLRKPESSKPLPLIVLSPGIDDWKNEMNDFIEPMLDAGFATLVIDLPGTGESPVLLAPGSHRVFSAVIAQAKELPGIAGDQIGFYGLSGGGYFAVAMALTDPNVRAVVNVGGPVHRSFSPEWLNRTPASIFSTLARCAGYDARKEGRDSILSSLGRISLGAQGLLHPRDGAPPLLTINGQKDILADPTEVQLIDELGIEQDMLLFENDGHVAPGHFDLHIPFSISWLQKKLSR